MILGIDASNLRSGGGLTHLVEFIRHAQPLKFGFTSVVIWGGKYTLGRVPQEDWLTKIHVPALDRNLFHRFLWQLVSLRRELLTAGCTILYAPGGLLLSRFKPAVTMCRNALPFEWREMRRFGLSWLTLKFLVLRFLQVKSFRDANGLIFLTKYARTLVSDVMRRPLHESITIAHGVNKRFFKDIKKQRNIEEYSFDKPFRIIYVSQVDWYKHQWAVVEATRQLRIEGFPVELVLIGAGQSSAVEKLENSIARCDPRGEYIFYLGFVAYEKLDRHYETSDLCVYASSCENLPNSLIEAMASGLPIISSKYEPMPEIVQDGADYFDPENSENLVEVMRGVLKSKETRERTLRIARSLAENYSWLACASKTLQFISSIATTYDNRK